MSIGGIGLHLRGEVRGVFMDWLRKYRPDLCRATRSYTRRGAYAPKEERERADRAALVAHGPSQRQRSRRGADPATASAGAPRQRRASATASLC